MVDFSTVRTLFPSVSFFFTHLGAFLESSNGHRPHVGLFISRDSAFRPILNDLYPLLHRSLNWYHLLCEMSMEERKGFVVRSTELEIGLSSNDKPMEMEVDSTASKPSSSKPSSSKHPSFFKARTFP